MSHLRTHGRPLALASGIALSLLAPHRALAGGFELTPAGGRANGRAGAEFARGDSAMSLFYNPSGLTRLRDPVSVSGSLHLHLSDKCYAGVEVDESSGSPQAGAALPEICADTGVTVLPELAASIRVGERLALGFGVYVPPASARHVTFGDVETGTFDPDGDGPMDAVPTPGRYMLMEQELLQLFLTLGAAYDIHPRVHVGAAFGWGITTVSFANAAYSRVDVIGDGVVAYADARSTLHGLDAFVPRLSFGVSAEPVARVPLTVGASFEWTGNVRTDSATLDVHGLSTRIEPEVIGELVGELEAEGSFSGVSLNVPQSARVAFGVRYGHALDRPADDIGDRLSNERFDVELDVVLQLNERVRAFEVDLPDDAAVVVPSPLPLILRDIEVELPDVIELEHRWRTQVAVQLGGDVNPIPGVLGLRAGLRFETRGVERGYEQLDFQPFRNVSAHLGATVRIAKRVDLSVAFAHVFTPDVTVSPEQARIRRIVSGDADADEATLANAGTFRANANVLVLEATAHIGRPTPPPASATR